MAAEPQEPMLLTDDSAIAAPPALVRAVLETLPAAIAAAGARTSERFIEFFTANIRNRNTRDGLCRRPPAILQLVRATRLATGGHQTKDRGRLH